MKVRWLALLLLGLTMVQATYVYGDIYRADTLEKLNHTLIRLEGPYTYQMISQKTNYSFDLEKGDYSIFAQQYDQSGNPILSYENSIKVGAENQRLDLVLRPIGPDWRMYGGVMVAILILAGAVWKMKQKPGRASLDVQSSPTKAAEPDADAQRVLQVLGSMEDRATQKELREALGFSEAKLSLILAELEQMGKIKKFKRGRGNIVRKLES